MKGPDTGSVKRVRFAPDVHADDDLDLPSKRRRCEKVRMAPPMHA